MHLLQCNDIFLIIGQHIIFRACLHQMFSLFKIIFWRIKQYTHQISHHQLIQLMTHLIGDSEVVLIVIVKRDHLPQSMIYQQQHSMQQLYVLIDQNWLYLKWRFMVSFIQHEFIERNIVINILNLQKLPFDRTERGLFVCLLILHATSP